MYRFLNFLFLCKNYLYLSCRVLILIFSKSAFFLDLTDIFYLEYIGAYSERTPQTNSKLTRSKKNGTGHTMKFLNISHGCCPKNNEIKVINKIDGQPGENFQLVATVLLEKNIFFRSCLAVREFTSLWLSKTGTFQPVRYNFLLWRRGHFFDDRFVVVVSRQHSGGILARSHCLESKTFLLK
jgi:hypothetical protein